MRTVRSLFGRPRLVGLLAAAALAAACKDNPILGPGEYQGTWMLSDSTGTVVLVVTTDSIQEYDLDPIADCYEHTAYRIRERDGREFSLESAEGRVRIQLYRDGDELVAVIGTQEERYDRTNVDPAVLPECPPPSVAAACVEQPPLVVDSIVEDSITASDPANPDGTHYDLYRIDIAAAAELEVGLSSNFDSYLILFDSLGSLVTLNDDASTRTLDAAIEHTFDPGCYMIMATTAFAGVFGEYELDLDVP